VWNITAVARHPVTQAASKTVMTSFKISPLRPRAFGERMRVPALSV
jgi:hypothetical protein